MTEAEKAYQYFVIAVPENEEQAKAYFWARKALQSTLTPPTEWVSVKDRLPQLPTNSDWCSIMVITTRKNDTKSRLMIYERAIVRGKRVERWKYYWDKIADDLPDYWMPLPEPPDSRPSED